MSSVLSSKRLSALAALTVTLAAAAAPSSAWALPVGGVGASDHAAPIRQVAAGQHRVYPGSNSAEAEKARAARNAPNLFCDKQESKCE